VEFEMQKAGVSSGLFAAFRLFFVLNFSVPELGRSCGSNLLFMDWVDNGFPCRSHAISGDIAAQHTQGNYMLLRRLFLTVAAIVLAAGSDTLLQPAPPTPCAESPDYVPGVDAGGNPVPRADLGAEKLTVTGAIKVPLRQAGQGQPGRGGQKQPPAYIGLDGAKLEKLVNPVPCHN
jgi:hypothetical protein